MQVMTVSTNDFDQVSLDPRQLEVGLARAYAVPVSSSACRAGRAVSSSKAQVISPAAVIEVVHSEDYDITAATPLNCTTDSLRLQAGAVQVVTIPSNEIRDEAYQVLDNETGTRAKIIIVTVNKQSDDMNLGMSWDYDNKGIIRITSLDPDIRSPLRVGDKISTINGKRPVASSRLKKFRGKLTIAVRRKRVRSDLVEVMVEKTYPPLRTGLYFATNRGKGLLVSAVLGGGLFCGSRLTTEDEIISINGVVCRGLSANEAYAIIDHAPRFVRIVARHRRMIWDPIFFYM